MPDTYGFDHLPSRGTPTVRCIDCAASGPLYRWPEKARARHSRGHKRERVEAATAAKEELALITAGETLDG